MGKAASFPRSTLDVGRSVLEVQILANFPTVNVQLPILKPERQGPGEDLALPNAEVRYLDVGR